MARIKCPVCKDEFNQTELDDTICINCMIKDAEKQTEEAEKNV